MTRTSYVLLAALTAFAGLAACSNQQARPLTASSADQAGYAERYPARLGTTRGEFLEQENKAQRTVQAFATYPDALNDPSWSHVEAVVDKADQAGRSSTYAERLAENRAVQEFFTEEKQELSNRVGGAVNYAAKQKGVQAEGLGGAAVHALDKAVEKQLEERLRDFNEAHRFIADNEAPLGKSNIAALEKQADEISLASYIVHVGIPQKRQDLQALIDESGQVRRTLQRTIDESDAIAGDTSRSDAEKSAARKRAEAARQAQGKIDTEVQQAEHLLTELEEREKRAKAEYDRAMDELRKKIRDRAAAAPTKAPES